MNTPRRCRGHGRGRWWGHGKLREGGGSEGGEGGAGSSAAAPYRCCRVERFLCFHRWGDASPVRVCRTFSSHTSFHLRQVLAAQGPPLAARARAATVASYNARRLVLLPRQQWLEKPQRCLLWLCAACGKRRRWRDSEWVHQFRRGVCVCVCVCARARVYCTFPYKAERSSWLTGL